MARKDIPVKKAAPAPAKAAAAKPMASTAVRHTAIPKATPAAAARSVVTHEMIAKRAFEISRGPNCGSEMDNWLRAERELSA